MKNWSEHCRDAPVSIDTGDAQLVSAICRLAAEGTAVRDIAALLSTHTQIVKQVLSQRAGQAGTIGNAGVET